MAYYANQSGPFWDFVQSMNNETNQPSGEGVDHAQESYEQGDRQGPAPGMQGPWGPYAQGAFGGFGCPGMEGFSGHQGPWARPGGWGRGRCHGRGGRGRHGRHERHGEGSPHREHGGPDRDERGPEGPEGHHHHGPPPHDGPRHGGPRRGHRGPPPPPFGDFGGAAGAAPFDFSGLLRTLSTHPLAQAFRTYAEQSNLGGDNARSGETLVPEEQADNSFIPPIDIFSTSASYVLHVALPGAKKEDVGVNWDVEKGELNIAGVVYRNGDEEFLKSLSKSERKVGVFERNVKLPLANEKDEIDGDGISAKLEDGVLVITVAKVEKEWTEVKRVDVE